LSCATRAIRFSPGNFRTGFSIPPFFSKYKFYEDYNSPLKIFIEVGSFSVSA
jgi:hypothetical protein